MTIRTETKDGTCVVYLEGRLDTVTAPEAESALNECAKGASHLVADLRGLSYISSAGLRVFLNAHKLMSGAGSFTLRNVGDPVREVLDITGFSSILRIE